MYSAAKPDDLASLAALLGFAPQNIFYLVEIADQMYFPIRIPKANGKSTRQLYIPRSELKGVQRAILKKILRPIEVSDVAAAYVPGRSIVQSAKKMCGSKALLKMDLKDFFPSISSRRVFGLFRSLGYNESVSYILTRLVTYEGAITQGSPCSPYISNLICRSLDRHLEALALSWSLRYQRYSDDLFFWGNENFNSKRFVKIVGNVIVDNGFLPNKRKTKYFRLNSPRRVLGLSVRGPNPRLPRDCIRRLRAAFHKASVNLNWGREHFPILKGHLEWYRCVNGADEKYNEYRRILDAIEKMKFHEPYKT